MFGVGESDPWWWEKKAATDVEVLACGGSIDWIEPLRQNSARSEIICVLTVLLRFRGLGVNVLHSTDYLYARDTVQNVQSWSAAQWCACSNRDLWESIAFLLDEYESAGISFRVFHNKAHPEDWQDDMFQYTALEQVAHVTDALVGVVKGVVEVRPDVPVLPGRNRWKLWHNNMEITGPISASMQSINRLSYIAQHFATSRFVFVGGGAVFHFSTPSLVTRMPLLAVCCRVWLANDVHARTQTFCDRPRLQVSEEGWGGGGQT